MNRCTALVLAAGQGSRFGSDKRLARLPSGQTLLAATLARVLEVFDEVYVVLRVGDDPQALGIPPQVRIVRAESAGDGMGSSLAAGIGGLADSKAEAVAVLLGDMPWVAAETLRHLSANALTGQIVVPVHEGQRGHPVLFGRAFWPALIAVGGDQGGRQVILDHPDRCVRIPVADVGVLRDVDRPGDLPHLRHP